ncbi:hypothetical protein Vadar_002681 [Vaccinium darrowii]|uniref:Uncharacterized protein n=1 Tax=Vaccinium darrowii TaxID=229202 RepID=A0ACB7Z153_9ERIC|nr:hypothetical protein Vadar_002681 [Vaccinium darrowii]
MKGRREVTLGKTNKAHQPEWARMFMGSGSDIEHEAFRHVLPYGYNVINRNVHNIAIHLARDEDRTCSCSIWAWERFPSLRRQPNTLKAGEPRIARWNKMKKKNIENVGLALNSARECFQWHPYAISEKNWVFPKFYKEREEWVSVCLGIEEDFESFARFFRPCKFVGLGCLERYLPRRVAMQFGMDQDLPGLVACANGTPEIAWESYTRQIKYGRLYVPSRSFMSDVTTRYLEWWKQSKLAQKDARKRVKPTKLGGKDEKSFTKTPGISLQIPKGKRKKFNREVKPVGKDKQRLVDAAGNRMSGDGKCFPGPQPQIPSSLTADHCAGKKMESLVEHKDNTVRGEATMGGSHRPPEDTIGCSVGIPSHQVRIGKPLPTLEGISVPKARLMYQDLK